MRLVYCCAVLLTTAGLSLLLRAELRAMELHQDYYLGFSQGAYYGLLLGGEHYDVAWCMKSELEYEAEALGTGGEFQARLEAMLEHCRRANPVQP